MNIYYSLGTHWFNFTNETNTVNSRFINLQYLNCEQILGEQSEATQLFLISTYDQNDFSRLAGYQTRRERQQVNRGVYKKRKKSEKAIVMLFALEKLMPNGSCSH